MMWSKTWIYFMAVSVLLSGCGTDVSDEEIHQAAEEVTIALEKTSKKVINNYLTEEEGKNLKDVTTAGSKITGSLLRGEDLDITSTVGTALDMLEKTSELVIPDELISVQGTCLVASDGDTYIVKISNVSVPRSVAGIKHGDQVKVRAFSINTPESVGNYADNPMPFGKEASNFAKSLLEGKQVELLVTPSFEEDPYGRLLAFVKVDGESVQGLLLENGLAMIAYTEPGTPFYDEFSRIQENAKQQKKGIWSIEGYVQPTGYNLAAINR